MPRTLPDSPAAFIIRTPSAETERHTCGFRLLAVSASANSFGLRKMVFLSRIGVGFTLFGNALAVGRVKEGENYTVSFEIPKRGAAVPFGEYAALMAGAAARRFGAECPEALPKESEEEAARVLA